MSTPPKDDDRSALKRLKWVVGTPYFVQGSKDLTEVPILFFIKTGLGMGDAGGQFFDSLKGIGWMLKPIWGVVSDHVRIFGYRRKAWYVLMAMLGVLFWMAAAVLAFIGIKVPVVYLIVFNLVFGTYAFVDVVCDAIMVVEGRRLKRVGAFVGLQWTVLSIANAASTLLGGWMQDWVDREVIGVETIFALAGIFPLLTVFVGIRNIVEERHTPKELGTSTVHNSIGVADVLAFVRTTPRKLNEIRKNNHTIWLLLIFLFFWKFSPSVGYIERSYLIDEREFSPKSFAIIFSIGGITFLVSVLAYRWMVKRFTNIQWHQYLYAMVAIGALSFPISFFLYLDPEHGWWRYVYFTLPDAINPFPDWNRYEWFRLISGTVLYFAHIPAFMIPLTINAHTVKIAYAGLGYALLTAFSNATNILEGVVGAGLYKLFSGENFVWMIDAFQGSFLDIAKAQSPRIAILEIFVYISLAFTLLTLPFIRMLRTELRKNNVVIDLGAKID